MLARVIDRIESKRTWRQHSMTQSSGAGSVAVTVQSPSSIRCSRIGSTAVCTTRHVYTILFSLEPAVRAGDDHRRLVHQLHPRASHPHMQKLDRRGLECLMLCI